MLVYDMYATSLYAYCALRESQTAAQPFLKKYVHRSGQQVDTLYVHYTYICVLLYSITFSLRQGRQQSYQCYFSIFCIYAYLSPL